MKLIFLFPCSFIPYTLFIPSRDYIACPIQKTSYSMIIGCSLNWIQCDISSSSKHITRQQWTTIVKTWWLHHMYWWLYRKIRIWSKWMVWMLIVAKNDNNLSFNSFTCKRNNSNNICGSTKDSFVTIPSCYFQCRFIYAKSQITSCLR